LGIGRRLVAPHMPDFAREYPFGGCARALSDRKLDLTAEGLDIAFFLGRPRDSNLRIRKIADCPRVLCASPDYIAEHGHPKTGADIERGQHNCLNLRYPGATEFQWELETEEGPRKFDVRGRYESDDGDVLTDWALAGAGIALKPIFEISDHLRSGALVHVVEDTPPLPVQMACLYTHRRHQDPKARLFMEFMISRIDAELVGRD